MARTNTLGNFLTDVAGAIRTAEGSSETIQASDFDTRIEALSGGGERVEAPDNDVIFYDYDGFKVYSYSASEFLALEAMPANPEHNGLIAQGWNWSLADAKEYVSDYGMLDIGQNYITDDGKTRIYITLSEGMLNPYLGLGMKGVTVRINWGDGNVEEKSEDTYAQTKIPHSYSKPGDYVITIESIASSGNYKHFYFPTVTGGSGILTGGKNSSSSDDVGYRNCINKIECGNDVRFYQENSFQYCRCLKTITIPKSAFVYKNPDTTVGRVDASYFQYTPSLIFVTIPENTTIAKNSNSSGCEAISLPKNPTGYVASNLPSLLFSSWNKLKRLSIPSGYADQSDKTCYECSVLKRLSIPSGIKKLSSDMLYNCSSLSVLSLPATITSIPSRVGANLYSLKVIDFSRHTTIPTLSYASGAFSGITAECKIIVPDDLYEDWIVATNWSSYASNIISKSDWDALQNT
jgi:hypothetical protein